MDLDNSLTVGEKEYYYLEGLYIRTKNTGFYNSWILKIEDWAKKVNNENILLQQQENAKKMTYLLQQIKIKMNTYRKKGQKRKQIQNPETAKEYVDSLRGLIDDIDLQKMIKSYQDMIKPIKLSNGQNQLQQPFMDVHNKQAIVGTDFDDQTEAALVNFLRAAFNSESTKNNNGTIKTSVEPIGEIKIASKVVDQIINEPTNILISLIKDIESEVNGIPGFHAMEKLEPKQQKTDVQITISHDGTDVEDVEKLASEVVSGMTGSQVSVGISVKNYSVNKYFEKGSNEPILGVRKFKKENPNTKVNLRHSLQLTNIHFSSEKNNSINGIIVPASQVITESTYSERKNITIPDSLSFYLIGLGRFNSNYQNSGNDDINVARKNPEVSKIQQIWNKLQALYEIAGYGQALTADYVLINDPVSIGIWLVPSLSIINSITGRFNSNNFNLNVPSISMETASGLVT